VDLREHAKDGCRLGFTAILILHYLAGVPYLTMLLPMVSERKE
jgi:hypothetical protein